MRRRKLKRAASLAALVIAFPASGLLGCQTEPIYEVEAAVVPREPGWTLADMTRAIQRAGARRGWDMRIIEEGHIEGRLRKPAVMALVDVRYTAFEFDIRYRDSENLDYSPSRGEIHNNYNRWVYNLERDVRQEFLRMRPARSEAATPASP